jgi:cation:H+ antiporter
VVSPARTASDLRQVGPAQHWAPLLFAEQDVLNLWFAIAAVIGGFVAVVWGADRFVYGAAGLARNLGVSRIVIGLTIVAFGTSAPELLVSGMAAAAGSREMGIGNAIGSNITNSTLVLGAAALAGPLSVHSRLLLREIPILFVAMAVAWWFLWDGTLSRPEAFILLTGMIVLVVWVSAEARLEQGDASVAVGSDLEHDIPDSLPAPMAIGLFLVGLIALLVGSRGLVWGAVGIAHDLGVSELVVGLTLVALGTSLPELAASVAAARRNEPDIAVGNVVGSNIFNLLGVLALPGIIAPGHVDRSVIHRDFPIMMGVTILLVMTAMNEENRIGRKAGIALIGSFVVYFVMLFLRSS